MTTVILLLLTAVACSGSPGTTTAAPAAGNSTVAPPTHQDDRKSEPYWVPVTSFTGSGNTATSTFRIDSNAIQWRLAWRCQTSPFTAVLVDSSGKESTRKLAYGVSCPKEAEGFSAEKGTQSLKITTAGDWSVDVAQQVNTPLIEALPQDVSSAQLMATATIHKVDRDAEGIATIYRMDDGKRVLRLDRFFVTRNADLEIRLSAAVSPKTTDEIAKAPFKVIAPLKATVGSMNYQIPQDVDMDQFGSLVIWCEITRNAYAAADIEHR